MREPGSSFNVDTERQDCRAGGIDSVPTVPGRPIHTVPNEHAFWYGALAIENTIRELARAWAAEFAEI